jgi:hypothetical protein
MLQVFTSMYMIRYSKRFFVHTLYMLYFKMSCVYCSCLVCIVVSCLVCIVVSSLVCITVSCLVCIVVVVLCVLL